MKAVMGESAGPSKSMRTCLVSEPQMPVSCVFSTAQSSPRRVGSGTSLSDIGVHARFLISRGASSGGCGGGGSPNSPKTKAFIRAPFLFLAHSSGRGDVGVQVGVVPVNDWAHVRCVALKTGVLDRFENC